MTALNNEKLILNHFIKKYNYIIEKASSEFITDNLKVSVDGIWKEKDLSILLEIDSYNSAKNIFGEYVLLNQVRDYESNCILVIIHCYKKYNTERTEKYLKFAVNNLNCHLPYVVMSRARWSGLVEAKSKRQLINILIKAASKNQS
jgi:hypothetical protein